MGSLVGLFGKKADCEQYIKAIDHTFYGFTGLITHLGCWENTRKAYKPLAFGSGFTGFSPVLPRGGRYRRVNLPPPYFFT